MGGAKREMMEHDDNLAHATGYLVQTGMLKSCEFHGTVFGGGAFDLDDTFWRRAVGSKKQGANGPVPWAADMSTREFTDLIKEAYEEHCGESCYSCDKVMAE